MIVYAVARYGTPGGGTAALWIGLAGAVIGSARWTGISGTNALALAVTACAAIVAVRTRSAVGSASDWKPVSSRPARRRSGGGSSGRSGERFQLTTFGTAPRSVGQPLTAENSNPSGAAM